MVRVPLRDFSFPLLRTLFAAGGVGAGAAAVGNLARNNRQRSDAAADAAKSTAERDALHDSLTKDKTVPGPSTGVAGLLGTGAGAAWLYPRRHILANTLQMASPPHSWRNRHAYLASALLNLPLAAGMAMLGNAGGKWIGDRFSSNKQKVLDTMVGTPKQAAEENAQAELLLKLAEIGAAVVAQARKEPSMEKQASGAANLALMLAGGAGAGVLARQRLQQDASLQRALSRAEDQLRRGDSVSQDDAVALDALMDRHRSSNLGLTAAGVGAAGAAPFGAYIGYRDLGAIADALSQHGIPASRSKGIAAFGGALGVALPVAVLAGLGGWTGKRIANATSDESRRARDILRRADATQYS